MVVDVHLDELDLALGGLAPPFPGSGVSCLHGPHHGAQKSTSTGWRFGFLDDVLDEGLCRRVLDGRVRSRGLRFLQHVSLYLPLPVCARAAGRDMPYSPD